MKTHRYCKRVWFWKCHDNAHNHKERHTAEACIKRWERSEENKKYWQQWNRDMARQLATEAFVRELARSIAESPRP